MSVTSQDSAGLLEAILITMETCYHPRLIKFIIDSGCPILGHFLSWEIPQYCCVCPHCGRGQKTPPPTFVANALALGTWQEKYRKVNLLKGVLDLSELFNPGTFLNALQQETAR